MALSYGNGNNTMSHNWSKGRIPNYSNRLGTFRGAGVVSWDTIGQGFAMPAYPI